MHPPPFPPAATDACLLSLTHRNAHNIPLTGAKCTLFTLPSVLYLYIALEFSFVNAGVI